MLKKILIINILLILLTFSLRAQSKDSLAIAEDLIYNQSFEEAIPFYRNFIKLAPFNPDLYFGLGFCYLNTEGLRDSSIYYFRKALDLIKAGNKARTPEKEIKFYLARAYRVNYQFDSAIVILSMLRAETRRKSFQKLIKDELTKTEVGLELTSKPVDVEIENLGPYINTKYIEHTPVLTADENELYFTSCRKLWPQSMPDFDGQYDENIYVAHKDSTGSWTKVVPLDSINTTDHEATISISHDGTKLFIYKDEDNGSIYISTYKDGAWQKPVKLGKNINTPYRETHASLSVSGKTLYFTSDRPGGYGGLDIYVSHLQPDGTWGKAKNLGPVINTEKDEEGPFIFYDEKTLFFSSKGHNTMGGYDIFKSTLTGFGTWTPPENLGYPINSIEDDVFYFPTADNQRAYFASKNGKGYGKSDIYMMKIKQAAQSPIAILTAKLFVCNGPLPQVDIYYTDIATDDYLVAKPKDSKFIIVAQKGHKYRLVIESKGKIVYSDTIFVKKDTSNYLFYKIIRLDPGIPCDMEDSLKKLSKDSLLANVSDNVYDTFIEIQNIKFPLNQGKNFKADKNLFILADYLKNNPTAKIKVIGYADASGKADYNYILGMKRALAVKNFLIKHGANPEQIVVESYGEENPIAINKNPDGTWNPQGQALNRRVEFRIIKQGDHTLLIKGMKVPTKLKNPNYKINYTKNPDKHLEVDN